MIQAIIFDCFGVLTVDLFKQFRAELPSEAMAIEATELIQQHDAGQLTRAAFLEKIQALTGKHPEFVEAALASDVTSKNTELLEYIQGLKSEYKIGLLSNISSDWITDTLLTEDEAKLFDDMIFSHRTNMAKPDPRIFQLAADNLGVAVEEAIFIDDSAGHCAAAKELGMAAVVYHSFSQMKLELESLLAGNDN